MGILGYIKETIRLNQEYYKGGLSQEKPEDGSFPNASAPKRGNATHEEPGIYMTPLYDLAANAIFDTGQASVSMIQRRLNLGYTQAAKIIDYLEECGIVGPFTNSAPRRILISKQEYLHRVRLVDEPEIAYRNAQEVKEVQKNKEMQKLKLMRSLGVKPNLDVSFVDPMEVIRELEKKIESYFEYFLCRACSANEGKNLFEFFKNACTSSKLPLAAEVRLESLLKEYEPKFTSESPLYKIDHMEGHQFEQWCADLLQKNGFTDIEVTKGSGDQGVDIIAVKESVRYAIQCKCYSSDLGNKPVQEVHAGKSLYRCHVGVVMTNQHFTAGAKELAGATGVLLWDRDKLLEMLEN